MTVTLRPRKMQAIDLFPVRVVRPGLDDPGNDAALVGHAHAARHAGLFERRIGRILGHAVAPCPRLIQTGLAKIARHDKRSGGAAIGPGIIALAR